MDKTINFNISKFINECESNLKDIFADLDETALYNERKVLNAFKNNSVAQRHFAGTNGYGYDDIGRDVLCKIYAEVLGGEKAIVSPLFVSGTHALSTMLFGSLKKGEKFLSVSGMPYDTLRGVIWGDGNGSLKDFGISFDVVPLDENGKINLPAVRGMLARKSYKMVYLQRSRGYELRDSFMVQEIGAAMEDYMSRRKSKQPLELPSAGSTFKRPVGAYAGALIDQCGLRGFRIGDAAISEKHCGFVVNLGQATCQDVLRLTDEVCRIVKEKTGFTLEKEIRVVR